MTQSRTQAVQSHREEAMQSGRMKSILLFVMVLFCLRLLAQEKKITREQLPAAVQRTVAEQSKSATVRRFTEEVEKGQTLYEAELILNGHTKDVLMNKDGDVVEVEEEVPFVSLSDSVKQGLQAKAGKGNLGKIESLTKNGKLLAYEAKVTTGNKKSEVQVGPDGKPLAHEE